jgi:glycine/D-amino acid oxidase-like deaminating enzyme
VNRALVPTLPRSAYIDEGVWQVERERIFARQRDADVVGPGDFLLDRLPDVDQVVVGLGAAHGSKFAAWFGRMLAALACGEPAGPELTPFASTRPSLHVPISREAWLV